MALFELQPIGQVRGGRLEPEDDDWGVVEAEIVLHDHLGGEALQGLEAFSHAWVIFVFDRLDPSKVNTGARRPRGNPTWPEVGIFAQRGSPRPNRLGLTCVQVVAVDGRVLKVRGLDAVDGSPVLDIKPHMSGFDPRGEVREPEWAAQIMAGYW
jgi:tRNA-Thr(GGU) m(6)t(6)A37 methyltransferase TsaA